MTPVMQTNSCGNVLLFFVSCVLSHNFIFSRFLGCCPFLGVSNKVETAAGMGLAVTFVMGLASLFTSAVYQYVLYPLQLTYLDTISFILIIAGLVQFVEMFLKKSVPALYKALMKAGYKGVFMYELKRGEGSFGEMVAIYEKMAADAAKLE